MKKYHRIILTGLVSVVIAYSCCEGDQEFWFPEGAIQYYDSQDTITFYCPESDTYAVYPICTRDTLVDVDHLLGRCDQYRIYHSKFYELSMDTCGNSNRIRMFLDPGNKEEIYVIILETDSTQNGCSANYKESTKFSTEVLGKTYDNVIRIPSFGWDWNTVESILFSYEYGVIQIEYEDHTLSLVNNEI